MQKRICLKGAAILLPWAVAAGLFLFASASKNPSAESSIQSQGPGFSPDRVSAGESLGRITSLRGTDTPGRRLTSSLQVAKEYRNLPMAFEANQGQADTRAKFLSRGPGYTLLLRSTEAVFRLSNGGSPAAKGTAQGQPKMENDDFLAMPGSGVFAFPRTSNLESLTDDPPELSGKSVVSRRHSDTVRMRLVGANPNAELRGINRLPGIANYFIGNDPKKWALNVPTFAKVECRNIYPAIQLVYYGNPQQLEYDFVVAPGADFSRIQLTFEGEERITTDDKGELLLEIGSFQVKMMAPHVYQIANDRKQELNAKYVFKDEKKIGFAVDGYDPSLALVIDPAFVYLMSFGGQGNAYGLDIQVDNSGSAYVVGITSSLDFPTQNLFQSTAGGGTCSESTTTFPCSDAFVTKLNPEGNGFIYSTYLGRKGDDAGTSLVLDSSGNAYLTGSTTSPDFPTKNAIFPTLRDGGENCHRGQDGDAFVTKLNASGNALVYSTYLGGGCGEVGAGIAIDGARNAHVTGTTSSKNFPVTPGSFQDHVDYFAGYVTKLTFDGKSLVYSTLGLGGADIAVDSQGYAYVAGGTFGGYGGKLSPSGSALEGVLATPPDGYITALSLDSLLNVYITGYSVGKISPEMLEQSGKSFLFLPVVLSLGGQNGSF